MSATDAKPETKPERRVQPDPKPLSTEYHKAHKQVMIWAAILLVWELVGVDLEKTKEAGGTVAALIESIKSPQAIPWVLLILIGYFLFKLTIEWHQCNHARRAARVARVDFFSAWCVSFLAYVLYIVQASSHIQIADLLGQSPQPLVVFGMIIAMSSGLCMGFILRFAWDDKHLSWHSLRTVGLFVFVFFFALSLGLSWRSAFTATALGLGISFLFQLSVIIWAKQLEKRLYNQP